MPIFWIVQIIFILKLIINYCMFCSIVIAGNVYWHDNLYMYIMMILFVEENVYNHACKYNNTKWHALAIRMQVIDKVDAWSGFMQVPIWSLGPEHTTELALIHLHHKPHSFIPLISFPCQCGSLFIKLASAIEFLATTFPLRVLASLLYSYIMQPTWKICTLSTTLSLFYHITYMPCVIMNV